MVVRRSAVLDPQHRRPNSVAVLAAPPSVVGRWNLARPRLSHRPIVRSHQVGPVHRHRRRARRRSDERRVLLFVGAGRFSSRREVERRGRGRVIRQTAPSRVNGADYVTRGTAALHTPGTWPHPGHLDDLVTRVTPGRAYQLADSALVEATTRCRLIR